MFASSGESKYIDSKVKEVRKDQTDEELHKKENGQIKRIKIEFLPTDRKWDRPEKKTEDK